LLVFKPVKGIDYQPETLGDFMFSIEKYSGLTGPKILTENAGMRITADFRKELVDAMKSGAEASPPDKERLLLIARTLQLEMNRRLLNSMLDGEATFQSMTTKFLAEYSAAGLPETPSENQGGLQRPSGTMEAAGQQAYDPIIADAAREFGVDADLIRSVIKAESGFDSRATSPRGAQGLMQLMPETAGELGVNDPYDPRQNIFGGARYLKRLLNRYDGHVDSALAAYNWGMGNLERSPDRLPDETVTYISRVKRFYGEMKT